MIPRHYKAEYVKLPKYYTLKDLHTDKPQTWEIFSPETHSNDEILDMIIRTYENDEDTLGFNEVYRHDDGIEPSDFMTMRELMTPKQKIQVDIYSLMNGNQFGTVMVIFNIPRKEVYWFVNEDWRIKDKKPAEVQRAEAWMANLELFQIDNEFSSLGGYHSDGNRFSEMIERFGWEVGIKMIKAYIQAMKKVRQRYKAFHDQPSRTHGDDEITQSYSEYVYSGGLYWNYEKDGDHFWSNIYLRYSIYSDRIWTRIEVSMDRMDETEIIEY
ncbi:MAG TPA: hypothetical protein PK122_02310 [Candidatus Paceibacterota bacterium]|nr:hypothetical protein [Candidatus Paceibacterota bacterium]